jgi:DNA-binding transcriptional LysR family regulator
LLRDTQDTLIYTQAASRGHVGELRIGINFSAPFYPRFPRLIARYRRQYPQVRLIFREFFYAAGIHALYNGEVDVCFTRLDSPQGKGKIRFQPFADDTLDLCLPRAHPLAAKKRIGMEDLKDELFLLSPRQTKTPLFDELQRMAHKAGFFMRLSQDTAHFPVIINLVAANYGIGFLPPAMKAMATGDVVFKKLDGLKPAVCRQPLALGFSRENDSVLLKNFLEAARED